MEAPESLGPGSVVAGYRVVRRLASGGMGTVFVAEHLTTRKERALKVMQPTLVVDAKARERFVQEAQIGAAVESEHIVEVIDAGIDAERGMPWLAMELLKGETLSERLARDGPLAPGVVRELFAQLCHALGAAHERGIVHRDLKPENLFLASARREGATFTLKVLDFGIAKILSEAQTQVTGAIGTPLFMAPEQMIPGRRVSPATDVWALGLIAFRLLTGEHYWSTAHDDIPNAMMLLNEVANLPLEPASARAKTLGVDARLPAGFDAWFARAVVRDPDERFHDAQAARAALDEVLGAAPATDELDRERERQRERASAKAREAAPARASQPQAAPAQASAEMATDMWLAGRPAASAPSLREAPPAAAHASAREAPAPDPTASLSAARASAAAPDVATESERAVATEPERAVATTPPVRRGAGRVVLAVIGLGAILGGGLAALVALTSRSSPLPDASTAPPHVPRDFAPKATATSANAGTGTSARGTVGRLPADLIQTVVRSHFRYLRGCYEQALGRDPHVQGSVNMRFSIERDGSVRVLSTEGSTLPDDAAIRCAAERFASIDFPRPEGGTVEVTYPLVFTPGADEPDPSASALFK